MATDGPTPVPCDSEIFQKGKPVVLLDARSNAAEQWVQAVATAANAQLDWHYSGGIAQVLHLGDNESRARVETTITELEGSLSGRIIQRLPIGAIGLYRRGITDAPADDEANSDNGGDSPTLNES